MLVIEGEKAVECARAMDFYKTEYAKAEKVENFFLPPYEYRIKNLEGRFDQNKYMIRQGDCSDYRQNRADADTATKNDVNILSVMADLDVATTKQIIKALEAYSKIEPDKYLMQGRSSKSVEGRLRKLVGGHLLRVVRCTRPDGETIENVGENEGAPSAYVMTPDGLSFLRSKKRGLMQSRAKIIETFSPGMFMESLIAGEVVEELMDLPGFMGIKSRGISLVNSSFYTELGSSLMFIDGHLAFEWNDEKTDVGIISVSGTPDAAIESGRDLQDWSDLKACVAREFLFSNRFNARVIFVCENMAAVDYLMKSFSRFEFSAQGIAEYCYITTAVMNNYVKRVLERNPLTAMLQVAYSESDRADYLTGMVLRLSEKRVRNILRNVEES